LGNRVEEYIYCYQHHLRLQTLQKTFDQKVVSRDSSCTMAALSTYVVTFNCARNLINPSVFAPHLLQAASNAPDLLVLCLQEIAPLGYAFLGGSFLTPYYNAFASAVQLTDAGYINVISRNIGLTAIMLFAKEEIAANISSIETGSVGVGVQQTGNKGGVGIRIGYEDTIITFVSAHLAPMEGALERRNEDFRSIAERLVFVAEHKSSTQDEREEDAPLLQDSTRGTGAKGIYQSTSHLIFAGDLNYRTSSRPPGQEDAQSFPQPKADPKDPSHWSQLLQQDQLRKEVEAGRTLNGLHEMPIEFPPTYKYRHTEDVTVDGEKPWKWASHRWPSWCDRIFYSATSLHPHTYQALPLFGTSDHRPVAMSVTIPIRPVSNLDKQSQMFKIDPEWRSKRDIARRKELVVGILAYLTWTKEGEALLLATIIAGVGLGYILRSVLA
jgi:hypothetical protein